MSFDDDFTADALPELFEAFGIDATVQRGADAAVPVLVIINRAQARLGEFGQVVARVDTVEFMLSQWSPQQGDRVVWTDRMGTAAKSVTSEIDCDGFVAKAVLHG